MSRDKSTAEGQDCTEMQGFEAFEVSLGDLMRGERATLGKSLLDVQRELRIKATYIAAIENCDLGAFESRGFIAGYVRSYSRYLGLDPEWAFETFCAESGHTSVSGQLSERSPAPNRITPVSTARRAAGDPFSSGRFDISLPTASALPQIAPGALGSILVLILLIAGLGYGGWSILKEVQQVQLAPIDQAPGVAGELALPEVTVGVEDDPVMSTAALPADGLDRLYRPQGLDLPVMVARDGPIAAVDPDRMGALAPSPQTDLTPIAMALAEGGSADLPSATPRVLTDAPPEVVLFAKTPVWLRVRDAAGAVLFEKTLAAGETYVLPELEDTPSLRAGNAGDLYALIDGVAYGPMGAPGAVVKNIALGQAEIEAAFEPVDLPRELMPQPSMVAESESTGATE